MLPAVFFECVDGCKDGIIICIRRGSIIVAVFDGADPDRDDPETGIGDLVVLGYPEPGLENERTHISGTFMAGEAEISE